MKNKRLIITSLLLSISQLKTATELAPTWSETITTKNDQPKKSFSLSKKIHDWKRPYNILKKERLYYLALIKSLAPELYKEIIDVDPTGKNHFSYTPYHNISIALERDGLPHLTLNPRYMIRFSVGEQRYIMSHELCHYILGHTSGPVPKHNLLFGEQHPPVSYSDNLANPTHHKKTITPEETFENSYSRIKEFEADRCAVLEFGASIDDGISWMQKHIKKSELFKPTQPGKKTFKSTHPLFKARIEQLENLRDEVALQQSSNKQVSPIGWKRLKALYSKEPINMALLSTDDLLLKRNTAFTWGTQPESEKDKPLDHPYFFEDTEYHHYLDLIKEIDEEAYGTFKQAEKSFGLRILQTVPYGESTVFVPTEDTYWYPVIAIQSIKDLSDEEQKAYLKPFIESYKALFDAKKIIPNH